MFLYLLYNKINGVPFYMTWRLV